MKTLTKISCWTSRCLVTCYGGLIMISRTRKGDFLLLPVIVVTVILTLVVREHVHWPREGSSGSVPGAIGGHVKRTTYGEQQELTTKPLTGGVRRRAILHSSDLELAGARSGGRHQNDGDWYSMAGDIELYVYSAHYDDRASLKGDKTLRIVLVSELTKDDKLYCYLWFSNSDTNDQQQRSTVIGGTLEEVGAGVYRHDKLFIEYILSCRVTHLKDVPTHVSVLRRRNASPSFATPVEIAHEPDVPQNIGICVSLSYWYHAPDRLVEWIEFQRMLGVDGIVIYNNSLSDEAQRVFLYYARREPQFLEIRQSRNFLVDYGELTYHLQMSPVINDCMYRYRKRFQKILVIDFDEQVVPYSKCETYQQMLDVMESRQPDKYIPFTYSFRNAYFFTNFEPALDQPKELQSLRYLRRTEFSEAGYSTKSIISTEVCIAMHNHYCWRYTPAYEDPNIEPYIEVSFDVGYLHHYKACHLDDQECADLLSSHVRDDRMLHFRDRLITVANVRRAQLGLSRIE